MIDPGSAEPVTLNGRCHCGDVQFTVTLTKGFASARRCTCSMCRMRGAVAVTSTPEAFRLRKGADKLATYRFNTRVAEHHFCTCACDPAELVVRRPRRNESCSGRLSVRLNDLRKAVRPIELGVNVACLEGVSPFDFPELKVLDGERHPSDDAEHRTLQAGVLSFQRTPD